MQNMLILNRNYGLREWATKGWTAPNLPKEYGGGGLDRDQTKVLHQELFKIKARPALNSFRYLDASTMHN